MDIKETGLYVVIMAVCREDAAPVELLGTIESMNPCTEYLLPFNRYMHIDYF
jgi:hypothetical protein